MAPTWSDITMALKDQSEFQPQETMDFLGKLIKIKTDTPDVDFLKASDIAKQTAKERSADPMMFSWY